MITDATKEGTEHGKLSGKFLIYKNMLLNSIPKEQALKFADLSAKDISNDNNLPNTIKI